MPLPIGHNRILLLENNLDRLIYYVYNVYMRLSFVKKRRSKKTRRKTHEMRRKKLKRRTFKKRRKKRMKAGGNPKIDKGLQYAEKLVGIKYSTSTCRRK